MELDECHFCYTLSNIRDSLSPDILIYQKIQCIQLCYYQCEHNMLLTYSTNCRHRCLPVTLDEIGRWINVTVIEIKQ